MDSVVEQSKIHIVYSLKIILVTKKAKATSPATLEMSHAEYRMTSCGFFSSTDLASKHA